MSRGEVRGGVPESVAARVLAARCYTGDPLQSMLETRAADRRQC